MIGDLAVHEVVGQRGGGTVALLRVDRTVLDASQVACVIVVGPLNSFGKCGLCHDLLFLFVTVVVCIGAGVFRFDGLVGLAERWNVEQVYGIPRRARHYSSPSR